MAGIWYLDKGRDLCVSDVVRTGRRYDVEDDETYSGDYWADGMPEIRERWYVADYRYGWITIAREVRPACPKGVKINPYVFEEAGEERKIRVGSKDALFPVALSPAGPDPRWERFGLKMPKEPMS
ncbi:hypothetical protein AB0P17_15905 [Streptomyces sp. NPDC088124]|uniref:hypothetical protein n=1 Tax=Streptomyces sp. NPDC088124 TaxID=3154654 RepID=UPI00341D2B4B